MNIFKSNKKQEPKPLSELETILKLQGEHTRMSILLNETHQRLRFGYTIGNTSFVLKDCDREIEDKLFLEIKSLIDIAREYVKLAEKTGEPIPEHIDKRVKRYGMKGDLAERLLVLNYAKTII